MISAGGVRPAGGRGGPNEVVSPATGTACGPSSMCPPSWQARRSVLLAARGGAVRVQEAHLYVRPHDVVEQVPRQVAVDDHPVVAILLPVDLRVGGEVRLHLAVG